MLHVLCAAAVVLLHHRGMATRIMDKWETCQVTDKPQLKLTFTATKMQK